jgi:hypothetical protein
MAVDLRPACRGQKPSLLDIVSYGDEEEEDADEPPQRQP